MGQYFVYGNLNSHEFVSPWAIGGMAKLWEWAANRQAGVIPYLLVSPDLAGKPSKNKMLGRWAKSSPALVGDYDDSTFYDGCDSIKEILKWGCQIELAVSALPQEFLVIQGGMDMAGIKGSYKEVELKG